MPKYNTLFDVAFAVEHDYSDPSDVPNSVLIEALRRRVEQLAIEAAQYPDSQSDAFGVNDTYEIDDET